MTKQFGGLQRETFDGHQGTTFSVVKTGIPGAVDEVIEPVELELTDVEDTSRGVVDSFSILFRGPRDKQLGQGTYQMIHQVLGSVDLFLVPILDPQPRDTRICYQAIISRLREPDP